MIKTYTILFLISSLACFSACSEKKSPIDTTNHPIVSVNGQTLYKTDFENIIQKNISSEDSAKQANAYIKEWIDEQLLYAKAKENIIDENTINKMVDDYRKTLVMYAYQERLLKQKFEDQVSDSELLNYYQQNKELFSLDAPIIKGLYLKIPQESTQLPNFRKWYKQTTDKAIGNIEDKALQYAVNYEYFYDRWVSLKDIMDKIPYQITDEKLFLQKNNDLDVSDSSFVYLLNIKEYKEAGQEMPYEYAKNKIIDTFLEKKKKDFFDQISKDLYRQAESKGDIKFHNQ